MSVSQQSVERVTYYRYLGATTNHRLVFQQNTETLEVSAMQLLEEALQPTGRPVSPDGFYRCFIKSLKPTKQDPNNDEEVNNWTAAGTTIYNRRAKHRGT